MADNSPKEGRKHSGKRRNCSLRAISPFSHCVFIRRVLLGLFGKRFIQSAEKGNIVDFQHFPLIAPFKCLLHQGSQKSRPNS